MSIPEATGGLAGIIATIAAIRASGETLAGPVGTLLHEVTENWVWLTVLSVAMTTAWVARRRFHRSGAEDQ